MPSKRIYYPYGGDQSPQLEIFRNTSKNLFICLSPYESHSSDVFIELPISDAIEIITDLAFSFDLIDDDPKLKGKMIWRGKSR